MTRTSGGGGNAGSLGLRETGASVFGVACSRFGGVLGHARGTNGLGAAIGIPGANDFGGGGGGMTKGVCFGGGGGILKALTLALGGTGGTSLWGVSLKNMPRVTWLLVKNVGSKSLPSGLVLPTLPHFPHGMSPGHAL